MTVEYDETPSGPNEMLPKTVRFLPGKATIKDDLQAIFEMEKEIGSAVFRLHKLIQQVQATANTTAKSPELDDALETVVQSLKDNHAILQARLDALQDSAYEVATHNQKIEDDWARIRLAANVTLRSHGVDPQTLAEDSEDVKKLGKWLSYGQMIIVGIIVTMLSTWVMSSYSKSLLNDQKAANEELIKETKQLSEAVKKQQQELTDYIIYDNNRSAAKPQLPGPSRR